MINLSLFLLSRIIAWSVNVVFWLFEILHNQRNAVAWSVQYNDDARNLLQIDKTYQTHFCNVYDYQD